MELWPGERLAVVSCPATGISKERPHRAGDGNQAQRDRNLVGSLLEKPSGVEGKGLR